MENKQVTIEQYESYCNLELLQKLYNKGFKFKLNTKGNRVTNNLAEQRFNEGDVSYCDNYITYSVLIEWLRINHGIWIEVVKPVRQKLFRFNVDVNDQNIFTSVVSFKTPQEVYLAAFDYILNNNLI
jgi:hypothetical protein